MTAGSDSATILLGFDFGLRRIGVAVGNRLLQSARPLTTLQHSGTPDWDALQKLAREWQPDALVVGIPTLMDGGEQPITQAARQFALELQKRLKLPVHTADERLSSVAAGETLKAERQSGRKRRIRKEEKDSMAASIILRDWMQLNPDIASNRP